MTLYQFSNKIKSVLSTYASEAQNLHGKEWVAGRWSACFIARMIGGDTDVSLQMLVSSGAVVIGSYI